MLLTRPFQKARTKPRGRSLQQREYVPLYSRHCPKACGDGDIDNKKAKGF